MANAFNALDSNFGGKGQSPLNVMVLDFALDTYTTGGVEIDTLLNAVTAWTDLKLPATSIFAGFCALDPDAEGLLRVAEFLPDSRKIVLKKAAAGPVLAEEANGAIGATVNLKLTVFLA